MTSLPQEHTADHLRIAQELRALEQILKNPKNRDVQKWASRRFIELTEPERKAA